jgi:hypothetical protein
MKIGGDHIGHRMHAEGWRATGEHNVTMLHSFPSNCHVRANAALPTPIRDTALRCDPSRIGGVVRT